ncbi:hypothetical protein HAX54_046446 [Datura stramonium]|uniref:Uncharacterized protein n=1 Tax=Datura stramonium TaxID=4076 RepID=A0ABS8WJ14_DATST|nr:hypothetical protein [Datura stramonium]
MKRRSYNFWSSFYRRPATHLRIAGLNLQTIVTSSRQQDKEKAPSTSKSKGKDKAKATAASSNTKDAIILCMPNMKKHYLTSLDRPLTMEKLFDLAALGDDFPNINA